MYKPKLLRAINGRIQHFILIIVDFIYIPFRRLIPQQLFRYGVCGGGNLVFDWVLYFLFFHFIFQKQSVELFSCIVFEPHIAPFIFTFPITFISGFWLMRYVSFSESQLKGRVQILRYLMVVSSNILFIHLLLDVFVEVCEFYPTPSKMISTFITTIYSYLMQKYFSFK